MYSNAEYKSYGECAICKQPMKGGGLYTNGDGYGELKKFGMPEPTWYQYCWPCTQEHRDQIPNHDAAIDKIFRERDLCGFLEAWIGRCRNSNPCAKHLAQKCWSCHKPATKNCATTGILVCGMPECDDHPHQHGR